MHFFTYTHITYIYIHTPIYNYFIQYRSLIYTSNTILYRKNHLFFRSIFTSEFFVIFAITITITDHQQLYIYTHTQHIYISSLLNKLTCDHHHCRHHLLSTIPSLAIIIFSNQIEA